MCRVVWPKVLHRRPPQVSPQQLLVVVVLLGIQVDLLGGFHIPFCQGPNKDSLLLLFPSVKRGRCRHRRPGQGICDEIVLATLTALHYSTFAPTTCKQRRCSRGLGVSLRGLLNTPSNGFWLVTTVNGCGAPMM